MAWSSTSPADAKPYSLDPIESGAPVKAVLELLAGTARTIGLNPGDTITHPVFASRQGSLSLDPAQSPERRIRQRIDDYRALHGYLSP